MTVQKPIARMLLGYRNGRIDAGLQIIGMYAVKDVFTSRKVGSLNAGFLVRVYAAMGSKR